MVMGIEEVYLSVKMRTEKNVSNDGISLDKSRFVNLFNQSMLKFVDDALQKKSDTDVEDVRILLKTDQPLKRLYKKNEKVSFEFPEDYYSFVNVRCVTASNGCTTSDFNLWQAKPENVHELLADVNNSPSFKYRETFYTIGDSGIHVYTTPGLDISKAHLAYYRQPRQVDIAGYLHPNGIPSANIDPEFADRIVVRIMDICVKEYHKNEGEGEKYPMDRDTVYAEK
jgi:hypothetical protein